MVVALVPDRDFRRAGCDERCEAIKAIIPGRFGRLELFLHDPDAHEEFGRATATIDGRRIVWTGGLVIDLSSRTVIANGREVQPSRQEWKLLEYLARHQGRVCSHDELLLSCWGQTYIGSHHLLRIFFVRLRDRLEGCASLIETRPGRGYVLVTAPPAEVDPSAPPPPARPWSKLHASCVCCSTTRHRHRARGICGGCRGHISPCRGAS